MTVLAVCQAVLVHFVLPKPHSIGVVRVSKVEHLVLSHIIADQNSVPANLFPYPLLIYLEPLFLPSKATRDNSRLVVVGRQERVSVTHQQESEVYCQGLRTLRDRLTWNMTMLSLCATGGCR